MANSIQPGSRFHPVPYPVTTGYFSVAKNAAECAADHLPVSGAKVQKAYSCA